MVHSNLNDGRFSTQPPGLENLIANVQSSIADVEQMEFLFEFFTPEPLEEDPVDSSELLDMDLPGNDYDWKYDADLMHQRILHQSLHMLMDNRASQSNKDHVIDWIFHPVIVDPRPFSFQACCIFSEVDTEALQDHLRWLIDRL